MSAWPYRYCIQVKRHRGEPGHTRVRFVCVISVPVCARVSRVCPGSPVFLSYAGTAIHTRILGRAVAFVMEDFTGVACAWPLHFPAPEQRPWLQVSALVVQTESFLHRPREGRTASPKKDRVIPATSLATKPQETNRRMPLRAPRRAPRSR